MPTQSERDAANKASQDADERYLKLRNSLDIFAVVLTGRSEVERYPKEQLVLLDALMMWESILRTMNNNLRNPSVSITIDGYDDDPRELWEIPEVVRFIRDWEKQAAALRDPRLLPSTRSWLIAMGCDPDIRPQNYQWNAPKEDKSR